MVSPSTRRRGEAGARQGRGTRGRQRLWYSPRPCFVPLLNLFRCDHDAGEGDAGRRPAAFYKTFIEPDVARTFGIRVFTEDERTKIFAISGRIEVTLVVQNANDSRRNRRQPAIGVIGVRRAVFLTRFRPYVSGSTNNCALVGEIVWRRLFCLSRGGGVVPSCGDTSRIARIGPAQTVTGVAYVEIRLVRLRAVAGIAGVIARLAARVVFDGQPIVEHASIAVFSCL